MKLVSPRFLPTRFLRHVDNIKYRGSTARLHLALDGLPAFKGVDDAALLKGAVQITPGMNYLQRAYDHVKYGRFSDQPYLDLRIPTLNDPSLAPDGRHTMSNTIKYAPYCLRNSDWTAERERLQAAALDVLNSYSHIIKAAILHSQLLTPTDLEDQYELPEGNFYHGEMTLDQYFHMRPVPGWAQYTTPINGLFLCGSGSHPGGGVTGLPGRNAAMMIKNR
jgi:phytoene dehydrogenase-like protein